MTPESARPARTPSRSRLRTTVLFAGALLFLFEEWLWNGVTQVLAWLGRFGVMRWLESRLARLPSGGALVMLCVPMLLLFPFKVAGLWMIATGHLVTGCMIMLAAKVASTAVIARIFFACRPQLLRMPWFARLYASTCVLRDRIHHWIGQQAAWQDAKSFVRHVRSRVRAWRHGTGTAAARRGALYRWRSRRKAKKAAPAATVAARRAEGDGR